MKKTLFRIELSTLIRLNTRNVFTVHFDEEEKKIMNVFDNLYLSCSQLTPNNTESGQFRYKSQWNVK